MITTKTPIPLEQGELCSIITAMLLQQGKTEFTLSLAEFDDMGIGKLHLMSDGEFEEGSDTPTSVTVHVLTEEQVADYLQSDH